MIQVSAETQTAGNKYRELQFRDEWNAKPKEEKEKTIQQSLQRRKRFLTDNPGKTLAELLPFRDKESCDRMEAEIRKRWDEIEIVP